ncbi:hypothetical protein EU546_01345 [Candidatus Thorarchaeota archaeon]|nr:MAG: hypothetical protein EU546_01345 [Candidatus Thorarchaeota archaeon]
MYSEFAPPDEGLEPGESILWNRRAGMSPRLMFCGGCFLIWSPWVLLYAYGSLGPIVANWVLVMVAIVLIIVVFDFINSRRTTYYLTTQRLLEVRAGLIQNEMPLELARAADREGGLKVKPTYSEGSSQFYDVRIRDPTSRKLFYLSGLDEDSKELILQAAQGEQ